MVDLNTIIAIITIAGIPSGLIIYLDRKNGARINRVEDELKRAETDRQFIRAEMQEGFEKAAADWQAIREEVVGVRIKISGMESILDLLAYGKTDLPAPVLRRRAEREATIEATIEVD